MCWHGRGCACKIGVSGEMCFACLVWGCMFKTGVSGEMCFASLVWGCMLYDGYNGFFNLIKEFTITNYY